MLLRHIHADLPGARHDVRLDSPADVPTRGAHAADRARGRSRAQPLTARGPFPPELVGAKAKDAVENALHQEVCAGTLTLQAAQTIIATDWFKYYKEKILK
jgi:hypothetical protein